MGSEDQVGSGLPVVDVGQAVGALRRLERVEDVLALMDAEEDGQGGEAIIALVPDAGATFLTPIFADLVGVICLSGNLGSHLAIVSRDYGTPALVDFSFSGDPVGDGEVVVMDTATGIVSRPQ